MHPASEPEAGGDDPTLDLRSARIDRSADGISQRAFDLEHAAAKKLQGMGVKVVTDVDKAAFQKIADPYLDKLAKDLGPHADKIKTLIRAIN